MDLFTEYRMVWLGALVVVGLLLVFKLLRYGLVLRAIYITPFVLDQTELVALEQIPEDQRALMQSDAEALQEAGFTFLCALRALSKTGNATVERFSAIYEQPQTNTYATLRVNHEAWLKLASVCEFVNYLRTGQHVATLTHTLFICPSLPSRMQFEAPLCATVAELWQEHRARIAPHIADSLRISPAGGLALQRASFKELAHHLLRKGVLRRSKEPGVLRYTVRGAHAVTLGLFAEIRRWQKFKPGASNTMSPAQEAMAFEQARAFAEGRKSGRLGKLILLLVTAGLFSVAFGAVFSWEIVPILLGVLFFHELGHFAAMKLFGYRDLSIFFIPLLGAATTGVKEHATPMQKVVVYLAGPVPGLVLGVAAWYGSLWLQSETLLTLGIVALVINLLNLLPFSPLDGGRIVEVLWFSRFPRVRVGFALLGALGLGALGLFLGDYFLGGLALLLLMFVPGEWRIARLIKRVREDGAAPEPELLRRIFTRMSEIYSPNTHPITRGDVAKRVLEATKETHPRLLTSLFGSALYLGSFLVPVAAAVMVLGLSLSPWLQPWIQHWSPQATAGAPDVALPDWEAQLRAAKTPEAQWRVLNEAGNWHFEGEDLTQAHAWFERAVVLADSLPERDSKRAQALLRRANVTEHPEQALADYREVDRLLVNPIGENARHKAEALERIADADPALTNAQKTELLTQALGWHAESGAASDQLPFLRLKLARLLDENQDAAGAEAMLRAGITPDPQQAAYGARMLVTQLGWFLIAHGRAPEAVALLAPHAAQSQPDPFDTELLAALAWAQNAAGQPSAALATLARIQPLPGALPFSKAQLPLQVQLDIAATLQASRDAGLEEKLQALAKRFAKAELRQQYVQQLAQRAQHDPWQATRWKAHQGVMQQLPSS